MPSAPGGPRVLLRRLREIMAEPVDAQERLDKIVILIAANMVAEVCSLYVMRGDGTLELFATEGLNREAVHLTTMRAGRGPRRPDRLDRRAARALGRPDPSRLLLPARDRRGDLPRLPRRAASAGRQHARRPRRPEPHLPGLRRGGDRGAPDHLDGACRDARVGRAAGAFRPSRRPASRCAGRSTSAAFPSPTASASATSCCTSRA